MPDVENPIATKAVQVASAVIIKSIDATIAKLDSSFGTAKLLLVCVIEMFD